jgi:SAM-dependent methyltransferase
VSTRFDRTADAYAARAAARDWEGVAQFCGPRRGDRALDVAAGPGLLSAALLPYVAEAMALDPAERLLAHAPAGVQTIVGRAEAIPLDDESFDIVTCVNGLHHIDHVARALDEMRRVLAPGGRLVLEDYLADEDAAASRRWEEIEGRRDPEHRRLLAAGEARALLVPPLAVDVEQTWLRPLEINPWLEVAGCAGEAAARIRSMIGSPVVELRVWRARFTKTGDQAAASGSGARGE